jgi:hypothetical protein
VGLVEDPALEARCRALVDEVVLPLPFSVRALADTVAGKQGWPISLLPLPVECGAEISGVCGTTDDRFLVMYPCDAAAWFELVVVCHGLAHLLAGNVLLPGREYSDGAMDRLLPALPLAGLQLRARLGDRIEPTLASEAELAASFLVARIEQPIGAGTAPAMRSADVRQETWERVEILRSHWLRVISVVPEVSPWPAALRRPPATDEALVWQQQRLVTEICDAERLVAGYLRPDVRDGVRDLVASAGLSADVADAARQRLWMILGAAALKAGQPPDGAFVAPWIPGDDSQSAATAVAARLHLVGTSDVDDVIRTIARTCGAPMAAAELAP